jgi:ParB-like chromosome segregation protein Spo0J
MITWKLEVIPIKLLKNHPKNPRQINKQQLQHLEDLIKKFGLIDKPIVNVDMTIIGGHQRVRILKKMKIKEVECWIPSEQLSEDDVQELLIRHNLNQGSWDYDTLANNFEALDLLQWGFSEEQLLDSCKESEQIMDEIEKEKKKSTKKCPECGNEF